MFTISHDVNSDINIDLMEYQKYYIQSGGDGFHLKDVTKHAFDNKVNIPSTPIAKMYFAELYLRGLAIENSIMAPVGLLIRANPQFVNPEYMRYFFQTNVFWDTQINRLLQSSSMKNIPMEKIRKFILQIPSTGRTSLAK